MALCTINGCPSPGFPHAAKSCHLIHTRDSANIHFAKFQVSSPRRSSCSRLRHLCPARTDVSTSSRHWPRLNSNLPSIKFDTGANILATPVPIFEDIVHSFSDTVAIADGSSIPITGSARVGASTSFIVPSFQDILVPQKVIEDHGAISILNDQTLQIYDTSTNAPLLQAISASIPLITTTAVNGEYTFLPSDLDTLVHRDSVPNDISHHSSPVGLDGHFNLDGSKLLSSKGASIARYYTAKFDTLL